MFNKLSLQKKMLIYYSSFIILLFLILIILAYFFMSQSMYTQSLKNMDLTVDKISSLLDSSISSIDNMSMQVYYNKDIQNIMFKIQDIDGNSSNYFDYNLEDSMKIRNLLLSYNYYRFSNKKIALFNDNFNFISSGTYPERASIFKEVLGNNTFINEILNSPTKSTILAPHQDWWSENTNYMVVSLIREFQDTYFSSSKRLGYIEVQLPYPEIEQDCIVKNMPHLKVIVLNQKGEVIYPLNTINHSEIAYYSSLKNRNGIFQKNSSTEIDELVYSKQSEYTGWRVIIAQPKADVMKPVYSFRNMLFLIGIIFFLVSIFFMYIITRNLTLPIKKMSSLLKTLSMDNLAINLDEKTNNEIVIFNEAINKTLDRLKHSMDQTIEARSSESKAHFLALQSQMNPHFIYNTLMMISSAGYELGSKKIVVICSKLSNMMRYIATLDTKKITIRDEIIHATAYLELLKCRFEDQLQYEIDMEKELYAHKVPKLILQPLAENSYNHGFSNKRPPWKIKIRGWIEDSKWFIVIEDNGIGIPDDKLTSIKMKVCEYREQSETGKILSELDIGGMGLSNIYCRLYIIFGDTLVFDIYINHDGGTTVKIGGPAKP